MKKFLALLLALTMALCLAACGDNAAMIGIPALRSYLAGDFAPLTLDADPNAALGTWSSSAAPVPPHWER